MSDERMEIHVMKHMDGGWSVRSRTASQAFTILPKQRDAVIYAKKKAKKVQGELYIHRGNGLIMESISYSNDACTPTW